MSTYKHAAQIMYSISDIGAGANSPYRPHPSACSLRQAAKLVENVAYEEAGEQPSSVVSQLIMLAADLERLSQLIEKTENVT